MKQNAQAAMKLPVSDGKKLTAYLDEAGAVRQIAEHPADLVYPAHKAASCRLVIDNGPQLEWWQEVGEITFVIDATTATRAYSPVDRPLDDVRADGLARLVSHYHGLLAAGFEYPAASGRRVQIDDQDRANIAAVGSEARAAKRGETDWPANFAWRMLDNGYLPLASSDDMIALGEAAKAAFMTIRRAYWLHRDTIAALGSVAEIAAHDVSRNW